MTAIIVDDEKKSRNLLIKIVEAYCKRLNIIGETSNIDEAFSLISDSPPDVVFLDIEMPNGSGFDLLKRFETISFEVIFTTAFDKYALRAIKFCALDYLLKPISIEELLTSVRKLEERVSSGIEDRRLMQLLENIENWQHLSNKIALHQGDSIDFVKVEKIIHCKAEGNYTHVFFEDGCKTLITRKIKFFEDLLIPYGFFRVHKSHLVNIKFIKKYVKTDGGYLLLENDAQIPISRIRKGELFGILSLS